MLISDVIFQSVFRRAAREDLCLRAARAGVIDVFGASLPAALHGVSVTGVNNHFRIGRRTAAAI
jgi:hypothetical protein